jgi:MarR family transcriptional regulator, organic hydroperoxide resistance regulator
MSTRRTAAAAVTTQPGTRPGTRDLDVIVETVIYLQTESRRLAREQCARLGVTATQLNVIKMLDEIGELSLSELSRKIAAQNSTVTGIVDRMVQADLVTREQSPEDRRVWRIKLSERGKQVARKIDVAPWDLLRRGIESLDKKDKETLMVILRKVAAHVTTELEEDGNGD